MRPEDEQLRHTGRSSPHGMFRRRQAIEREPQPLEGNKVGDDLLTDTSYLVVPS